jgi:hypothetical protein
MTARPAEKIHVLSVGSAYRSSMIHNALLEVPNAQISLAPGYRELWAIPQEEDIQVVTLHDSLPSFELEAACRLIRRRWPRAQILILRSRACSLDDALYDDVVASTEALETLLAAIQRLIGK